MQYRKPRGVPCPTVGAWTSKVLDTSVGFGSKVASPVRVAVGTARAVRRAAHGGYFGWHPSKEVCGANKLLGGGAPNLVRGGKKSGGRLYRAEIRLVGPHGSFSIVGSSTSSRAASWCDSRDPKKRFGSTACKVMLCKYLGAANGAEVFLAAVAIVGE